MKTAQKSQKQDTLKTSHNKISRPQGRLNLEIPQFRFLTSTLKTLIARMVTTVKLSKTHTRGVHYHIYKVLHN